MLRGCCRVLLSDIVRTRRLKLFGHVARADKSQDHSRALRACIWHSPKNWKRRLGRPRHTWLRTVEWRQTCVRSTSVLHQGSRRHRTELPGAHSRERLRHRQAPNDDDDDEMSNHSGFYADDGMMYMAMLTAGTQKCAQFQSSHRHKDTNTRFYTGQMPFLSLN